MTEPEPTTEPPNELLAVAPLLAQGPEGRRLLGPCMLLRARDRVVGFASRALFAGAEDCVVATSLDGSETVGIGEREITRDSGIVAFVLEEAEWSPQDVVPLDPRRIGALDHARRGLPFVVGVAEREGGYRRAPLRVAIEVVDTSDWGGGQDEASYHRAHAREPLEEAVVYEGAPLLARHPASRVLDRPAETLAYGFALALAADALEGSEGEKPFAELVPMPPSYGV